MNPAIILNGKLNCELPELFKEYYYFDGWFTTALFGEEDRVTDSTRFTSDVTLYAHFIHTSEAHPLYGKNSGVYYESLTSTSTQNGSGECSLTVDFFGRFEFKTKSGMGSLKGRFTSYDEDTGLMKADNGAKAYYDKDSGIIAMYGASSATGHYTTLGLFFKGMEETYTQASVTLKSSVFDNGAYRYISYTSGDIKSTFFCETATNVITTGVVAEVTDKECNTSIAASADALGNNPFVEFKKDGQSLKKFAFSSSYLGEGSELTEAGNLAGIYDMGGSKLLVGVDYLIYGGKIYRYTADGNTLTVNQITVFHGDFLLNPVNMTASLTEYKCVVTYEWNGHKPENAKDSKEYWEGSWVYTSDFPKTSYKIEGTKAYILEGWYVDKEFEEPATQIKIFEDATYYAKWEERDAVTLTIGEDSWTFPAGYTFATVAPNYEIPTPKRDGYAFAGWFMDEGLTKKFENDVAILENTTLHADWIEMPSWGTLETANEVTQESGVFTFAGSTNQQYRTWYGKFTAEAGSYFFTSTSPTRAGSVSINHTNYARYSIIKEDGTVLDDSFSFGNKNVIDIPEAGTYYIAANLGGEAPTSSYNYQVWGSFSITAEKMGEGWNATTAFAYTLGEEVTGTPRYGKDAVYALTVEEGKSYTITFTPNGSSYSRLSVYTSADQSGKPTSALKFGSTSYIGGWNAATATFTATSSGTYYVTVETNPGTFSIVEASETI
ncbi:MAG: InlB B-repeat-containing protein [Bacilli bacterium]|nr:InlB B-repeat-containing protein [Bacilli bacterium]